MQDEFPFPSLDFPGRTVVTVAELADKLGVTEQHIINLIECQELAAVNTGRVRLGRAWYRIPLESWHAWLLGRVSAPVEQNPLHTLSTPVLRRLLRDIAGRLEVRGDDPAQILNLNAPAQTR